MRFPQSIRKFILLVHILTSVGWIGAVAVFLALALTGLNNPMPQTARALYIAMDPITTCIIVPFAIASLTTGLIISLGTRWGLFRHYWVFFKFLINTLSLPILFLHISIIHRVAAAAKSSTATTKSAATSSSTSKLEWCRRTTSGALRLENARQ